MDILLSIFAFVLIVIGVIGCVVPIIPGPVLAYCGYLCCYFCSFSEISTQSLIIFLLLTIVVTVLDFILPSYFAKLFGGSRAGSTGAFVGLIIGMMLGSIIGAIVGPFIGAAVGEYIHDRSDIARTLKVAFGSFLSFILGTGIKLILCVVMAISVFSDIFTEFYDWIVNLF